MAKKRKRVALATQKVDPFSTAISEEEEDANEDSSDSIDESVIVVGTYEGALLGFRSNGAQTFGYAPHTGCVKTLNCSQTGRLASGGTDHSVRLFDLSRGTEMGELQEHEDTVSCVDFAGSTTLVTAGDDGKVCIWRCADWELLLKFQAHKAGVAAIAAHSSGRLMASSGRDRSLRLWDLTRGTSAANLPVDAVTEMLEWAPDGHHLAALSSHELLIVDARSASTMSYQEPSSVNGVGRITLSAMTFLRDDIIMVGDEKGNVRVLVAAGRNLNEVCRLPADAERRGRVKGVVRCGQDAQGLIFAFGMSMGRVEIWRLASGALPSSEAETAFSRLEVVDAGVRITCVTAWSGPQAASSSSAKAVLKSSDAAVPSRKGKKLKKRKLKNAQPQEACI